MEQLLSAVALLVLGGGAAIWALWAERRAARRRRLGK